MKFKKEKQGKFNMLNFTPPPPQFSKILAVLLLFVGSDVLANPYVTLKHTGRNVISGCGDKSKFVALKVTAHNFPEEVETSLPNVFADYIRTPRLVPSRPEFFQYSIPAGNRLWYDFYSNGLNLNLNKNSSTEYLVYIRIKPNTNRINSNNRHNFRLEYERNRPSHEDYDLPPPVTIHLSPGTNQGCGPDQNLTLDEYAKSIPCENALKILDLLLIPGYNNQSDEILSLGRRYSECVIQQ